jgi:hypothetical protein
MSEEPSDHQRMITEIRCLRLILAALDDNDAQSTDSLTNILLEFSRCEGCSSDVILALLDMVTWNCGAHRDHWVKHLQRRLMVVSGWQGAPNTMPSTVADIETHWAEGDR